MIDMWTQSNIATHAAGCRKDIKGGSVRQAIILNILINCCLLAPFQWGEYTFEEALEIPALKRDEFASLKSADAKIVTNRNE